MPTIHFAGQSIECLQGANLRSALTRARLPLYNSAAKALNCRGRGACGACAVQVEGEVSEPTEAETKRMGAFPHRPDTSLRLACQTNVLGDVMVTKHDGLWGQKVEPSR